jgi:hypothetical protein
MRTMKDYYKILGLEPGAGTEQIHKAYRNLAKVYHPDLNNSEQANNFFIQLNEAYNVLSDENSRIPYDQQYLTWQQRGKDIKAFHYDWDSINRISTPPPRARLNPPGQLMQVVFGTEMFLGFTEALLVLGYIFRGPIHPVYVVFCIPGILLVIDGWKGIMGRKSALGGLIKMFRKIV